MVGDAAMASRDIARELLRETEQLERDPIAVQLLMRKEAEGWLAGLEFDESVEPRRRLRSSPG